MAECGDALGPGLSAGAGVCLDPGLRASGFRGHGSVAPAMRMRRSGRSRRRFPLDLLINRRDVRIGSHVGEIRAPSLEYVIVMLIGFLGRLAFVGRR